MMHGLCGPNFSTCGCMEQKVEQKICRFNYSKAFTEYTITNAGSYPLYKRRNTGEEIHMRGGVLDNRWVISYNLFLLAMLSLIHI